jgi:hypothetical protein
MLYKYNKYKHFLIFYHIYVIYMFLGTFQPRIMHHHALHYACRRIRARLVPPLRGVGGMVLYCIQPKTFPHNFSCNKGLYILFVYQLLTPTHPSLLNYNVQLVECLFALSIGHLPLFLLLMLYKDKTMKMFYSRVT